MGIDPLQFQAMRDRAEAAMERSRLGPKRGRPRRKSSQAVEEEQELHSQIREECARRGWLPLHGSMAHRTFRTPGEWDFVILAEFPRVLLVECKDRDGKVSKDQAALHAWARRLGHRTCVARSLADFLEFASENQQPTTKGQSDGLP